MKTQFNLLDLSLKLVFLILVAIYFTGCDSKDDVTITPRYSCTTLEGTYTHELDPSNILTIRNDCTFTDTFCGYDANYTPPTVLPDSTTTITVFGTNGAPGCLANASHACMIGYDGVQLAVECMSGAYSHLFNKQ